jgi:hypothetical protein
VLSPLLGLLIEAHEVVLATAPRYPVMVVGLVLIGIPVDAALRALSGGLGPSSPATPPSPPSSPPPLDGG